MDLEQIRRMAKERMLEKAQGKSPASPTSPKGRPPIQVGEERPVNHWGGKMTMVESIRNVTR